MPLTASTSMSRSNIQI